MGCCNSTSRSAHSSPYSSSPATAAVDSSRANIASHPSSPPSNSFLSHSHETDITPRLSHHSHQHHQHHGRRLSSHGSSPPPSPLAGAPNAPLRPLPPNRRSKVPHSARWTRARLQRERNDFFDTRVTGRQEVWGVVRMVVDLIRVGDVSEAQGVLDAAGCTCPSGDIWKGLFDERGAFYQVPEWVIVEPGDLVEKDEEDEEEADLAGEGFGVYGEAGKIEKGKGRAIPVGELVKVRARLSDRGTDVVVQVGKEEHVRMLVNKVHEVADIPLRQKVKIGYLGKILHDNESLAAQGWHDGHVVNALVFQ